MGELQVDRRVERIIFARDGCELSEDDTDDGMRLIFEPASEPYCQMSFVRYTYNGSVVLVNVANLEVLVLRPMKKKAT